MAWSHSGIEEEKTEKDKQGVEGLLTLVPMKIHHGHKKLDLGDATGAQ